jgi:hypothetical protein
MPESTSPNELREIIKGLLLLLTCHMFAGIVIYAVGLIFMSNTRGDTGFAIFLIGAGGFLFWQLIYVLPLIVWRKRRGKLGMMKGVIIGAIFTALLNGSCFVLMGGMQI